MIKFLFENILTIIDNFTQHKNLSYIKEIIGSDLDIFFDIGCHKGETIDLVNKTFKVKKIFAFDADKDCISGINHKKLSNVHFYSNARKKVENNVCFVILTCTNQSHHFH